MTRLDGEKKSPLPWIIGLIVLALLAAALYYFAVAKGNNGNNAAIGNAPIPSRDTGSFNADNSANSVDMNVADMNMADANMADSNVAGANAMDSGGAMMGGADSNMADSNAMGSGAMGSNSAMDSNSAMSNSTTNSSGTMMPVPALTPASASPQSTPNGVVATRSKTIKTGDATVIYQKSVKADGSVMRDKKIVAEPVKEAKKP